MKCKVCSRKFKLNKRNKYLIEKSGGLLACALPKEIYEAFDCPRCGCQNIVNIRETMIYVESIIANRKGDERDE